MQKLLIPIFAIIFVAITIESSAQTPQQIGLPAEPIKYTTPATGGNPESVCNFAGSFTLAQFIGNSNDRDLPELFLCAGDSFLLKHNGDAILNGDPNPATTPGIAYALYECRPQLPAIICRLSVWYPAPATSACGQLRSLSMVFT